MAFQLDLLDLSKLFNVTNLSTFTHNIPIEWIESALRLSSSATIRKRRLPSDQVLWLILEMVVFRDKSIQNVAKRLNTGVQGLASQDLLARSGITEARKRLGVDPVEWLFHQMDSIGGKNVILIINGKAYKYLLSMVHYLEHKILLN